MVPPHYDVIWTFRNEWATFRNGRLALLNVSGYGCHKCIRIIEIDVDYNFSVSLPSRTLERIPVVKWRVAVCNIMYHFTLLSLKYVGWNDLVIYEMHRRRGSK